ncbi:chromodomain-helicase-DNA-binding protein 1 homolog, putative [Plasmodium gallinaceum]|uniref:Chromodomain-helicase-DNA-binding protein 1 homolog, putative n=1 Tax=Plasmodium gallinaceum TaxID=5849 RepID=A0A1J1GXR2_PLAGA|nr:chromodomain-helicase-DNA-binding protein 1 homolog, putative [Plasmodium gallinaceum]CRG97253.1 chromodomain-helicase-DNA-binding protein 1 homolog, putative [Plasmodium gallinaceum]
MDNYVNNSCQNDHILKDNKNNNSVSNFSTGESTIDGINTSMKNSIISNSNKNIRAYEDIPNSVPNDKYSSINSNSLNTIMNSGNMRDLSMYGDVIDSENSNIKNMTPNYMNQVNKNISCSPYLNNSNNLNIPKNNNFNSNSNSNTTISITNSLLNNEQNMQMRQHLGMNKNCGALHDSYQKSLLSSYGISNVPLSSINSLMNNSMNRYNTMNYPLQEINQNAHINNVKSSMQNNDIKQNNKDQNFISQNNLKQGNFMSNNMCMNYQRNDMALRNNSAPFNVHGNFYPYVNNGFYGSSNCFKSNTNIINNASLNNNNSINNTSSYENVTRTNNNSNNSFTNNLNTTNYGETNCNTMNILNKGGNIEKSVQMKSLPNSMSSNNVNTNNRNSSNMNNSNTINSNNSNLNTKNINTNNINKNNVDPSNIPNNVIMNMVNNNIILNNKMINNMMINNNKNMNNFIPNNNVNIKAMNVCNIPPYMINNSLDKQNTLTDVNNMRYQMNIYNKIPYNNMNDYQFDNSSMNIHSKNDNIIKEKNTKEEKLENENGSTLSETNNSLSSKSKKNKGENYASNGVINNDSISYKKYKCNDVEGNNPTKDIKSEIKDTNINKNENISNINTTNPYTLFPNYNVKYPVNVDMFNNINSFNMPNKNNINNNFQNLNIINNINDINTFNNMNKLTNINNYNIINTYNDNRFNALKTMDNMKTYNDSIINSNHNSSNLSNIININNINNFNNMNYINNRNYTNDINMRILNRNMHANMNNNNNNEHFSNVNELKNNNNKYIKKTSLIKQASKSKKSLTQKKKKRNVTNSYDSDDDDDNDLYVNSYVKKVASKTSKKYYYDNSEDKYNDKMRRNEKNDIFVSPNIGTVEGRTNLRERRKVYNYAEIDNYFETDEEDKKIDEEKYLLKQEKQSMGGIDKVLCHRKIIDYNNLNNIANNPFLYINKKKKLGTYQNDNNESGSSNINNENEKESTNNVNENENNNENLSNSDPSNDNKLSNMENDDNAIDEYYEEEDIVDINEVEFLIKWIGKSHIHNFFCTYEYLKNFNGLKKVDNYIKKIKQSFQKRKYMTPDEIEQEKIYSEIKKQIEMDAIHAERIVTHDINENTNEQIFLVKWMSCSYDQCTEETKQTLIDHGFEKLIEEYYDRESKICGSKAMSSIWNRGPLTATKFDPYNETPFYLNNKKLRPYQLTGLNWIVSRMKRNLSVLLADEMGLGKTVQTIAVIGHMLYKEKLIGPYLIIVPQSTVDNWLNEFKSWLPQANVVCYHGNAVSRELIRTYELKKVYVPNKGYRYKFDVCITTPSILNSINDVELLKKMPWQLMVVDEAHQLKNRQSKRFIELKQFMAESKLLLSGTPLHNNLEELWTLLHFLNPQQYTYYETFQKKYNEIENTSLIGEAKQKQLIQLQHELHEVILRRVKKDVEKSLPNKVERILRVELSPIQIEYYKNILTKNYEQLAKASGGAKNSLQNICMELKKVCNHPFLCCEPVDKDEYRERLVYSSGKICLLEKLLNRLKERGNRVLIFSQMVKMLNILSEYLTLRGFKHQRLDGTMTKEMRKKAMNHFNSKNSDDFVFLLSTKAGGLGINLTSADTVIIYDSDWNPQNDLQAGARAHRIGQTKTVQIYRLVTKDSIEQTILERAKVKMVLDTLVVQGLNKKQNDNVNYIGGEGGNANGFTREELSKILKFGAQKLWEQNSSKYSPQKLDEEKNIIKGVDVDLDKILEEAEINENASNANISNKELNFNSDLNGLQNSSNFFNSSNNLFGNTNASGTTGGGLADDLLSSYNNITEFKYEPPANLKSNIYNDSTKADEIDEEENDKDFWDRTIPLEERLKLKRMKEEELLVHGPRKTRAKDMKNVMEMDNSNANNLNDDDDSEEYTIKYNDKNKNMKKKRRRRRTATHITEKDKFRLYRSLLKFGNPYLRLDDIQEDSKLIKVDKNVILTELNIIVDTCKQIVEKVSKENNEKNEEITKLDKCSTECNNASLKTKEEEKNTTMDNNNNLTTISCNNSNNNKKDINEEDKNNENDSKNEDDNENENSNMKIVSSDNLDKNKNDQENILVNNKEQSDETKEIIEDENQKSTKEDNIISEYVKKEINEEDTKNEKIQVKNEVNNEEKELTDEEEKNEIVENNEENLKDNDILKEQKEEENKNGKITINKKRRGGSLSRDNIKTNEKIKEENNSELVEEMDDQALDGLTVKNNYNSNDESDFNAKIKGLDKGKRIDAYTFFIGTNRANALDLCQRLKLFKCLHNFIKKQNNDNEYSFKLPLKKSVLVNEDKNQKNNKTKQKKEEVNTITSTDSSNDYLKLKLPDCIFYHLRDLTSKDVKSWTREDDENLIRGIYVYGFGSFNEISSDVNLNLSHLKNIKCDKVKMRCVRILKLIEEMYSKNNDQTNSKKRRRMKIRSNKNESKNQLKISNFTKSEESNINKVNNKQGYNKKNQSKMKSVHLHQENEIITKEEGDTKKEENDNMNDSEYVSNSMISTQEKKKVKSTILLNDDNKEKNNNSNYDSSACSSSNENKSNCDKDDEGNIKDYHEGNKFLYDENKKKKKKKRKIHKDSDTNVENEIAQSNEDLEDDEYEDEEDDDKKREKKNFKKKRKRKMLDHEIEYKIKNCNLKEMDQYSINKLAKKSVKKYKKLLKVVKKVLSSETLEDEKIMTSSDVTNKVDELIIFIGRHVEKLSEECQDNECKEIFNNSCWGYISKFISNGNEDLKEKYKQLKLSNIKDNISEEDLSSFFYSKKTSTLNSFDQEEIKTEQSSTTNHELLGNIITNENEKTKQLPCDVDKDLLDTNEYNEIPTKNTEEIEEKKKNELNEKEKCSNKQNETENVNSENLS